MNKGRLFVVATPIGNFGDFSQRAINTLKNVDLILAEDTRRSARLFSHFGIEGRLRAYHEHNESTAAVEIVEYLQSGADVALISDAGTPLLSDPGFIVVRLAREATIQVVPVPGPSSLMAALSVAGLPTDRFVFEGFLPPKAKARRLKLKELVFETRTTVFFESPRRLGKTLKDIGEIMGNNRKICLARELTKTFEQIVTAPVDEIIDQVNQRVIPTKGEFVVLVQGYKGPRQAFEHERLMSLLLAELPLSKASEIGAKLTGMARKELYDIALNIKDSGELEL